MALAFNMEGFMFGVMVYCIVCFFKQLSKGYVLSAMLHLIFALPLGAAIFFPKNAAAEKVAMVCIVVNFSYIVWESVRRMPEGKNDRLNQRNEHPHHQ